MGKNPTVAVGIVFGEGMNKTEAEFAGWLRMRQRAGEVEWWEFEPVKLNLGKRCWYMPDFLVIEDKRLIAYEVKGFWRDDARVKLKAAARRFPWIRFVAVKKDRKTGWKFEGI